MRSFDDPDTPQRKAAGPRASVWVSASAGTGKTRVLIDRLLWLMLDGTDPARILCLTFTRAAAAEMANRLNEELANWATLRSGALAETLQKLTGRMPSDATIARARQLFARVLETPGGIKIATIHAFCQTLLRRFPLEAGVPTEFAVLDERSAREALIEAGERVVIAARNGNEPELAEALAVVARYAPEERFGVLMAALAAERGKLRDVLGKGHAELRDKLCRALSLPAGTTEEAVIAGFCAAGAGDETAAVLGCSGALQRILHRSRARRHSCRMVRDPGAAPSDASGVYRCISDHRGRDPQNPDHPGRGPQRRLRCSGGARARRLNGSKNSARRSRRQRWSRRAAR